MGGVDIYYCKASFSVLPRISVVDNYSNHNYDFTNYMPCDLNITLTKEGISEFSLSNGCKYTMRPGDIGLVLPGISYSWKTQGKYHSHIGLHCSDNIKYEILDEKDVLTYRYLFESDETDVLENNFIILPFQFTPAANLEIEKKLNLMYMEYTNQTFCTSLVLSTLFLDIAAAITRACLSRLTDIKNNSFKPSYNIIYSKKIIDYLNQNYKNDLDIDILANSLKLNRDYMCYIFRKTTNCTLVNYLNKLRINKAKELMLSSNCRLNTICKEVGIENEYYFSKLFKKYEGISFKQYRSAFSFSILSPDLVKLTT